MPIFAPAILPGQLQISALTAPAAQGPDQAAYTFSAVTFGAADPTRIIVAGFGSRANAARAVSSVTIGGLAATVLTANSTGGGADMAVLAYARVPTGTSGDIVITFSDVMLRCGCAHARIVGECSTTPFHTNTSTGTNDPRATTLNIPDGGAAFGVCWGNSTATATFTWTGLTELADFTVESASGGMSIAGNSRMNAATSRAISVSIASQTVDNALAVASWAPR